MNDTVGIYYETPDGRIAYTYGWNGPEQTVMVYYNEVDSHTTVSVDEWHTWKPRRDLKDFPDSIDPRLPYEFDLHYDIKFMSQLKAELATCKLCVEKELRELMQVHGIKC